MIQHEPHKKTVTVNKKNWWEKSVVYQIYPKSFKDSNNDGIGDIQGIIQKLDYVKQLGIDVIWLSPVYKSPMDDNGYDISDYQGIAEEFGSMQDMEQLIEETAKRDIKIIMDLVINHTSDEHEWFVESKMDRHHPKRNWYIWRDGKETGEPPNNWQSVFGGSCWEYEPETDQYYLRTFSKKQPDLNWENPELREAIYKMIDWWVNKGIAGFRVDAITFIKKKEDFDDLPLDNGTGIIEANQTGIHEFLSDLSKKAFRSQDLLTVAEAPGVTVEQLSSYVGEDGYFSMLFEFDHVDLDIGKEGLWCKPRKWTLFDFKKAISSSQNIFNEQGWGALYLENHDQPRSLNKFIDPQGISPVSAKMLAAVYFLLKGTPFIHQGQELGMTNAVFSSIEDYNDLASIDQYHSALKQGFSKEKALAAIGKRSRDNARTPMQWDKTENAGFSSSVPWLAVNDNYRTINAENVLASEHSLFSFYQQLIHLRKTSKYADVITYGSYEDMLEEHPDVMGYIRKNDTISIVILANFRNETIEIPLSYTIQHVILNNYHDDFRNVNQIDTLTLRPYECIVYEIKR